MIVRCLACGKIMIADEKHPGFQTCGCENETMVDWCDEYLYRLGGADLSKIEVDGKIAGPKPKKEKMEKENREKLKDAIKTAYQRGYRDGFTDAAGLMRDTAVDLVQSIEENLEKHTIVVDEEDNES